jgi:hypothetical protein|tara:strand:- start:332 stop:511 length:180 start_codon:yes stop_codon:yes gene_type:complete
MSRRTYERDAEFIEEAADLEDLVIDKRENWRSSPSKAIRRQRRYKKKLIDKLLCFQKTK